MGKKSILIVDDEVKIVDFISSYLEKGGYEVYKAYSGMDALSKYEKFRPTLVILDLMLPDLSGEKVCIELRKRSRVPVIMLTAKVEENDLLAGFKLGADDYITKPFSPRELMVRIKAIFRRTEKDMKALCDRLEFRNGELIIDSTAHEVLLNGKKLNLTLTEYRLLHMLASYPQRVYSRTDLSMIVLGDDYDGNDRTIDAHIKNLRRKINDDPKNPCYIVTVFGMGYKFKGDDDGV
ncbi:MAG: response regulator transcription factor [Spirochaetales bacterium]|nr:response regulator transcription factor [Spirochaetales bacterium]